MSAAFQSTFAFLIIVNIVGLLLIKADKKKLLNKETRIKEVLLFTLAAFGGGIGEFFGMVIFRHKTYKWYFKLFMPIIAVINIVVSGLVLYMLFEAGTDVSI